VLYSAFDHILNAVTVFGDMDGICLIVLGIIPNIY